MFRGLQKGGCFFSEASEGSEQIIAVPREESGLLSAPGDLMHLLWIPGEDTPTVPPEWELGMEATVYREEHYILFYLLE